MSQLWYTSKTFWTMIVGLVVYIANAQFGYIVPESYVVTLMAVLGIIFRWVANTPLSVKKQQ